MALRQAVADGIIDVTWSRPRTAPCRHWVNARACAANGMTGLEQALSIIQMTLADTGMTIPPWHASLPRSLGEDWSPGNVRPLAEGEPANIVLVDPKATCVIKPEEQALARVRNQPLLRHGARPIRATFCRWPPRPC